jgi:uncharacterized paraquat-inducible protein A
MSRAPLRLSVAATAVIISTHVFIAYCRVRAPGPDPEFGLGHVVIAAIFIPLFLPETFTWLSFWSLVVSALSAVYCFYIIRIRPERRWNAHQCSCCGYSRTGLRATICPECGSPVDLCLQHAKRWRVIGPVGALICAMMLPIAAGEYWLYRDFVGFKAEVNEQEVALSRQRPWPVETASLVYVPGRGIHATD